MKDKIAIVGVGLHLAKRIAEKSDLIIIGQEDQRNPFDNLPIKITKMDIESYIPTVTARFTKPKSKYHN